MTALAFYLEQGGGSRGARAVCSPGGDRIPQARTVLLRDFRFIPERDEDRDEQIYVRLQGDIFVCETRPIRRRDRDYRPFFERDWPDYLTGAVHHAVGLMQRFEAGRCSAGPVRNDGVDGARAASGSMKGRAKMVVVGATV